MRKINTYINYVKIARLDHWIKNFFALPGYLLAIGIVRENQQVLELKVTRLCLAAVALCIASSANYTLNEWLDRESDRYHPTKKLRPSALGLVTSRGIYTQYILLSTGSVLLSMYLDKIHFALILSFLALGVIYNAEPLRAKNVIYLDVIIESANNPVRFSFGWFLILDTPPPSSALFGYWAIGAFMMSVKRYSEKKNTFLKYSSELNSSKYRRSLAVYSEQKLLDMCIFYALLSSAMFGIFLEKYSRWMAISFPFLALFIIQYLRLANKAESSAENPEKLFKEKYLLVSLLLLIISISFPIIMRLK